MTYRGKGEKEEKDIVWKGYVAEIRGELFLILIRKAKFAKHLMQRYAIICTAACTAPIELYLSLSLSLLPSSPLSHSGRNAARLYPSREIVAEMI